VGATCSSPFAAEHELNPPLDLVTTIFNHLTPLTAARNHPTPLGAAHEAASTPLPHGSTKPHHPQHWTECCTVVTLHAKANTSMQPLPGTTSTQNPIKLPQQEGLLLLLLLHSAGSLAVPQLRGLGSCSTLTHVFRLFLCLCAATAAVLGPGPGNTLPLLQVHACRLSY
jgi:hypothetical protein